MGKVVVAPSDQIKRVRIELKNDITTGKVISKKEYEIINPSEYKFNSDEGMAGRTSEEESREREEEEAKTEEVLHLKQYIKI